MAKDKTLSPEEQEVEDRRILDELEAEEAAKNSGRTGQGGLDRDREAVTKRLADAAAARRAKEATVPGVVARGRSLFTEAGQTEPHGPGSTVMLTPEEHAKLVQSGHILADDGNIVEPEGPKVYNDGDSKLIRGHAAGQGSGPQPAKK